MIAVDTNILVYAHREDAQFHAPALECMRGLAEGRSPWAIPWPCIHEFLAIVTHPRIYAPPSPIEVALDQVNAWLESPTVVLLGESDTHMAALGPLITSGRIAGAAIHDARVAAICLQNGVRELWTADRDFGRFPDLVSTNPLIS